jgi:hypothetical protein
MTPSLLQGSAEALYISEFKKDPSDKTTAISVKVIKAPNGDFDGDELNFTPLLDVYIADQASTLAPHFNVPGRSKPYEISGNLTLLAPATAVVSRYLRDTSETPDLDMIVSRLVPEELEIEVG